MRAVMENTNHVIIHTNAHESPRIAINNIHDPFMDIDEHSCFHFIPMSVAALLAPGGEALGDLAIVVHVLVEDPIGGATN